MVQDLGKPKRNKLRKKPQKRKSTLGSKAALSDGFITEGVTDVELDEPSSPVQKYQPPSKTEINRLQLAAALIEYDDLVRHHGPDQRALQSAILAPFRELLLNPRLIESDEETDYDASHSMNLNLDSDIDADDLPRQNFKNRGRRPSRTIEELQSRYSRSFLEPGPTQPVDEVVLSPEEEKKLADEWGFSEVMSRVGSEDHRTVLERLHEEKSLDDLETRSLPGLDHKDSNISFLPVKFEPGHRARTRSLGALDSYDLPTPNFDSFIDDVQSIAEDLNLTDDEFDKKSLASSLRLPGGGPDSAYQFGTLRRVPSDNSFFGDGATTQNLERGRRLSTMSGFSLLEPSPVMERRPSTFSARSTGRMSTFSTTPSMFTSKFDPVQQAIIKSELESDRPVFSDPNGGKPPKVINMPTPLAGLPYVPPKRKRPEGPSPETDESDLDYTNEDERYFQSKAKTKRPAGLLYGRSLIDVLEERKNLGKAQARHHDPGKDGRRPMADFGDTPSARAALALRQSRAEDQDEGSQVYEEHTPRPRQRLISTRSNVNSVFGPDLFYQRDLKLREELEEIEREEREEQARLHGIAQQKVLQKQNRRSTWLGGKGKDQKQLQGLEQWPDTTQQTPERTDDDADTEYEDYKPQVSQPRQHVPVQAPSLDLPASVKTTSITQSRYRPVYNDTDWFHSIEDENQPVYDSSSSSDDLPGRRKRRPAKARSVGSANWAEDFEDSDDESKKSKPKALPVFDPNGPPPKLDFDFGFTHTYEPPEPETPEKPESEDEDDVPLGVKAGRSKLIQPKIIDSDDEDLPLGVRKTVLATKDVEADDVPLGLTAPGQMLTLRQQQYEAQKMEQMAIMQMAYQQQMQMHMAQYAAMSQHSFQTTPTNDGSSSAVDRWRYGIE